MPLFGHMLFMPLFGHMLFMPLSGAGLSRPIFCILLLRSFRALFYCARFGRSHNMIAL